MWPRAMPTRNKSSALASSKRTCCAFRRDGSEFTGNAMSSGVEMRKSVTVSARASKLLTSTAQVSTNEAEPKIFSKITVAAVRVFYTQ